MSLKDMVPYIGWREYDYEDVQDISKLFDEIDASRRYSGFQIAWLGFMYGNGLKDIGPRE